MAFLRLKPTSDTDEGLLELYCESGKMEYFGRLYDRYIPLLYGLCLKYLQDEDEAQDAIMQLFEDLASKVRKQKIETFRTWLYSVAKNHCLQVLRQNEQRIQVELYPDFVESDEFLHLLEEEDDDEERLVALRHCLAQLPESQRTSIFLFFHEGLSYADIVDKTSFPLSKVKSYIQNGKRNLKNCIERQICEV